MCVFDNSLRHCITKRQWKDHDNVAFEINLGNCLKTRHPKIFF
jgi:hypothetical protein